LIATQVEEIPSWPVSVLIEAESGRGSTVSKAQIAPLIRWTTSAPLAGSDDRSPVSRALDDLGALRIVDTIGKRGDEEKDFVC
jgi:hypothetical protein